MILNFRTVDNEKHFISCEYVIDVIVEQNGVVFVVSSEMGDSENGSVHLLVTQSDRERVLADWKAYHTVINAGLEKAANA